MSWLVGKVVGHFAMGVLAIAVGTLVAPAHKWATSLLLLALITVVSVAALLTSELPFAMIGPLSVGFVGGAGLIVPNTPE